MSVNNVFTDVSSVVLAVSNRGPEPNEGIHAFSGGAAPAIYSALQRFPKSFWFSVRSACSEFNAAVLNESPETPGINAKTLHVGKRTYHLHYDQDSNSLVWPFSHGQYHRIDRSIDLAAAAQGNETVCALLAESLVKTLQGNTDIPIWVHDYQLTGVAKHLRKIGVTNPIVYFHHIPVPLPDDVNRLEKPLRDHLVGKLENLAYYDAALFQTGKDARHFMEFMGVESAPTLGFYQKQEISVPIPGNPNNRLSVGNFPISIDTPSVMKRAEEGTLSEAGCRLADQMVADNVILNFERCDYSKGILQRALAFEKLLEERPELRGKVQLVLGAEPTRSDIAEYVAYKNRVAEIANRLNGQKDLLCQGKPAVIFLNENVPNNDVLLLLRGVNEGQRIICAVTPYQDGMNLVAKEWVASQNPDEPGVLIVSSGAGASQELDCAGKGALVYNSSAMENGPDGTPYAGLHPSDDCVLAIKDQMYKAITMPKEEAKARHTVMLRVVKENDLNKWANSTIAVFNQLSEKSDTQRAPMSEVSGAFRDHGRQTLSPVQEQGVVPTADSPSRVVSRPVPVAGPHMK